MSVGTVVKDERGLIARVQGCFDSVMALQQLNESWRLLDAGMAESWFDIAALNSSAFFFA